MLRIAYETVADVYAVEQKIAENRDYREELGFWRRTPRYIVMRGFATLCLAGVGAAGVATYWEYEGNPFAKLLRPAFHETHHLPASASSFAPNPDPAYVSKDSQKFPNPARSPSVLAEDPALREAERTNSELLMRLFYEKYGLHPHHGGHRH